jgi:multicomponent Na+:H+ antiporter subunit B
MMLTATAVALLRIQSLFVAAMLTGIYSLLSAALFVLLDAVDVAFTEAAVGAGITTVLFLGMLARIPSRPEQYRKLHLRVGPMLAVLITGAALIYATHDMPAFGDPKAPANVHVAPRYINDSAQEVGPPNIVTSVLASYRGYDTLGEVTVIFTAGVGVLLLLGHRRRREDRDAP